MSLTYLIAGLEGTGTHPRLDLNDLQQNDIQFSLFIRALNQVLDRRSEDASSPDYIKRPDSWWELGGIHGLPHEAWTGDPNGPQTSAGDYGGYCYHRSALFPTWHRVQLLLVEQVVVRAAIDIASKLPSNLPAKPIWVDAANRLRFPFWDWTREQTRLEGIPKIFQEPEISIVNPSNPKHDTVSNPLNHYRFSENYKPGGASPLGNWPRTFRHANDATNPTTEDYGEAQRRFNQGQNNNSVAALRLRVAALFNYPLTIQDGYGPNLWGRFSTTTGASVYVPDPRYNSLPSLEGPHDSVHVNTGGLGTMGYNDYASFDPIFFLHHCNVDRIYAFWEWVYPNYWIGENGWKDENGNFHDFTTNAGGTFGQGPNSPVKADTVLHPFRIQDNAYWTSEKVRGLLSASKTLKYYTYPGIVDKITKIEVKPHSDNNSYSVEDREKFRQALYNEWGTDLATDVNNIREVYAGRSWDSPARHLLLEEPQADDRSYLRNYVIVGDIPEFAFPGSYRLELYLLPDGNGPVRVIDDISVFGRLDPDQCAACRARRAAGSRVRGHIHLEPLLIFQLLHWSLPQGGHLPAGSSPLAWIADQIKEKFRLRLVAADGTKLADTEIRENDTRAILEADKTPRLTLHWHRIWFHKHELNAEKGYIPLGLHESQEHGELVLGGVWRKEEGVA